MVQWMAPDADAAQMLAFQRGDESGFRAGRLFRNRAGLATRSVSERSAQMRSRRLLAPALALICLFVAPPLAWSQGGNPPASIKESGATPGHGMTAAEQTGKSRNAEQTIQALTEELRQAFLTGDVATFDRLLADDFIHITAWGTSATKPEVLARFKSGKERWEAVEISEMTVRVYGDTALVDSTMSMTGRIGDMDIKGPVRAVRVWVKRNGLWQSVLVQYTRIARRP